MFYLISVTPHIIVHVSSHFLESTLHWSCFIFISFSPQSISFISPTTVHLNHVYLILVVFILHGHSTSLSVSPFSQSRLSKLVSLDKFLILDRHSLLEADLQWFYYSLSLYIKQEIQHRSSLRLKIVLDERLLQNQLAGDWNNNVLGGKFLKN